MKHDLRIIGVLVTFYLIAQVVGLGLVYTDAKVEQTVGQNGQTITEVTHPETVLGPRPEVYNFDALVMVLISVLVGTGLVLLIVKFNRVVVWKGFFFFAVLSSITIAVGVFASWYVTLAAGAVLSFLKVWKKNVVVQNFTEILIYAGIALLFAPLFEPAWVILLLLAISGYDMFAVWKSKHMVKMAEFQIKSDAFAGLSFSYKRKGSQEPKDKKHATVEGRSQAILGGGDVAFPLIFAASVMESLFRMGILGPQAFFGALIIPIVTAAALLGLLVYGKRGRYYPAMPFMTAGCLFGYAVILAI